MNQKTAVKETWLPLLLEGVPDDLYEISDYGRVRRLDTGGEPAIVAQHGPSPRSARWVSLRNYGKVRVDRLVLDAFHPPVSDPDLVPVHINGDRLDCHPENLRWGTRAESVRGFNFAIREARQPSPPKPVRSPHDGVVVQRYSRYCLGSVELVISGDTWALRVAGGETLKLTREDASSLGQLLNAAINSE